MDQISIIVPIYNGEEFIEKCINSLQRQTYENIEIVLIDDGSIDNTAEICKSLLVKDSRIKYFYQENDGEIYARKKGCSVATGTYITFVDADDTIDSNMCQYLLSIMKEEKADCVSCKIGDNKEKEEIKYERFSCSTKEALKIILLGDKRLHWGLTGKLFDRKLLLKHFNGNNLKIGGDLVELVNQLLFCKKIIIGNAVMYFYNRENTSSVTTEKFSKNRLDLIAAYSQTAELYEEIGLKEEAKLWRLKAYQYAVGAYWRCYNEKIDHYEDHIKNIHIFLKKNRRDIIKIENPREKCLAIFLITAPKLYLKYFTYRNKKGD